MSYDVYAREMKKIITYTKCFLCPFAAVPTKRHVQRRGTRSLYRLYETFVVSRPTTVRVRDGSDAEGEFVGSQFCGKILRGSQWPGVLVTR